MSTPIGWASEAELDEIISVAAVDYLTPHVWLRLIKAFPSLAAALKASQSKLVAAGLTSEQARAFCQRPNSVEASKRLMASQNIRLILFGDPDYPTLLGEIADPPLWLFVRGSLEALDRPRLTVVGTRKPSGYAQQAMKYVFSDSLLSQVTILSGLAYGIDKAAHQLSLAASGKTIAVLAGGLDSIYPTDHARLAEKIIATGGALLSEYPPLSRPRPYRFPIRNRILAGLSPLTVVVEAALKSGSLTTAKAALDYNRDVMAIPGEINRSMAEGGNFLIKHGAALLSSPADLHIYYQIRSRQPLPLIDKPMATLLDLVTSPKSVDELALKSGREVEVILSELTQLELLGLVYQPQPGHYQKIK